MTMDEIWKLLTDPFYPHLGQDGQALPREALERDLRPLVDKRVLPIYFDVYDWTSSALLCGLSPKDALSTFPTARTLPSDAALLVIISGARQTGSDSLANLILYKLSCQTERKLLECEVALETRDRARNTAAVARAIIDAVDGLLDGPDPPPNTQTIVDRMRNRYDRSRKEHEVQKDATYSDVFNFFSKVMAPLNKVLAIKITQGGDHDSWARILESVNKCASYVIVTTPEPAYAKTCYEALSTRGQNVTWIRTRPLGLAKARDFVKSRLDYARKLAGAAPSPIDDIFPFSSESIAALYEPGAAAAGRGGPVEFPVGWIRQTLFKALADKKDSLDRIRAGTTTAAISSIDPRQTTIGAADVARARDALNRG